VLNLRDLLPQPDAGAFNLASKLVVSLMYESETEYFNFLSTHLSDIDLSVLIVVIGFHETLLQFHQHSVGNSLSEEKNKHEKSCALCLSVCLSVCLYVCLHLLLCYVLSPRVKTIIRVTSCVKVLTIFIVRLPNIYEQVNRTHVRKRPFFS
jgi:hypothetical protein